MKKKLVIALSLSSLMLHATDKEDAEKQSPTALTKQHVKKTKDELRQEWLRAIVEYVVKAHKADDGVTELIHNDVKEFYGIQDTDIENERKKLLESQSVSSTTVQKKSSSTQ